MRLLACCSLRMMKGRPYSSKTMDMVAALWGRRSGLRLSATACSEDFSTRKRCRSDAAFRRLAAPFATELE